MLQKYQKKEHANCNCRKIYCTIDKQILQNHPVSTDGMVLVSTG
jgi:hypothetical protein